MTAATPFISPITIPSLRSNPRPAFSRPLNNSPSRLQTPNDEAWEKVHSAQSTTFSSLLAHTVPLALCRTDKKKEPGLDRP